MKLKLVSKKHKEIPLTVGKVYDVTGFFELDDGRKTFYVGDDFRKCVIVSEMIDNTLGMVWEKVE